MRRHEKAISDRSEIDAVIRSCQVCRLGLSDGIEPYIVPMCFGYDGSSLYFHSATEGRKLAILAANSRVCFEFDRILGFAESVEACRWGIRYRSVVGTGTAHVIEDADGKRAGLGQIMAQYSGGTYTFPEQAVSRTSVIRVDIDTVSGKQSL